MSGCVVIKVLNVSFVLLYREIRQDLKLKKNNSPKIESPNTCINSKNYRKTYFMCWLEFSDWSVIKYMYTNHAKRIEKKTCFAIIKISDMIQVYLRIIQSELSILNCNQLTNQSIAINTVISWPIRMLPTLL